MSNVIPFAFHNSLVRVIIRDGAPWWCAADVCAVLEIKNARDAVGRLPPKDCAQITMAELNGQNTVGSTDGVSPNTVITDDGVSPKGDARMVNIVSEAGLYKLIFTSRKAEALEFQDYVTSVILPTIRKTGRFSVEASREADNVSAANPYDTMPVALKLSMVRTADIASRNPAARAIWDQLSLPALIIGASDQRMEVIGSEALAKIMQARYEGRLVRHILRDMLDGSEDATNLARGLGFIHVPREEGVAIASATLFLRRLFGDEPFWRDLRNLAGARSFPRLRFGPVQSRCVLVPLREIEDAASAVYDGLFEDDEKAE